ncbi:MAG TPA: molybdenum cofactor biosynthesis protein MoaE [Propionibacteriaceae bacterium]
MSWEAAAASPVVREASVVDTPLSVDRLLGLVADPRVGGIAVFIGVVRDHDSGADVASLDYTAHPSATQVLADCARRTAEHHDVLTIAVQHRVGHLEVGDLAVVVVAGAVHRAAALAASSHLINLLKAEVPIWKEQHFVSGDIAWVGLADDSVGPEVGS